MIFMRASMRILLKTSAPWIVLAVTTALSVAFCLPFGKERLNRTTYSPMRNLVVTFAAVETALNAQLDPTASATDASMTPGQGGRPLGFGHASGPTPGIAAHARAPLGGKAGRQRSSRKTALARALAPAPPESPDKHNDAPSPIEGIPMPAAPPPQAAAIPEDYTPDLIRDSFDGELSKFPLDAKTSNGRVVLRLEGLCRWQGHFILKVAVDNQTGADFFVKELSAYDGSAYIALKSYFRLLVEPGRTREGHVLFDAPAGAKVKITLKEDRENGRVMDLPVRYPF